jgi:rhodanese-related sulfurtransferase
MGLLDRVTGLFGDDRVRHVTTAELVAKLSGEPKPILIEALASSAFKSGHLPGAINLPRTKVKERAEALFPDKGAELIVYCKNRR